LLTSAGTVSEPRVPFDFTPRRRDRNCPEVALDTSVLLRAYRERYTLEMLAALRGRAMVLSPTALQQFTVRDPLEKLAWLAPLMAGTNGRVSPPAHLATTLAIYRDVYRASGIRLSPTDAAVAAAAANERLGLITADEDQYLGLEAYYRNWQPLAVEP